MPPASRTIDPMSAQCLQIRSSKVLKNQPTKLNGMGPVPGLTSIMRRPLGVVTGVPLEVVDSSDLAVPVTPAADGSPGPLVGDPLAVADCAGSGFRAMPVAGDSAPAVGASTTGHYARRNDNQDDRDRTLPELR